MPREGQRGGRRAVGKDLFAGSIRGTPCRDVPRSRSGSTLERNRDLPSALEFLSAHYAGVGLLGSHPKVIHVALKLTMWRCPGRLSRSDPDG